MAELLVRMVDKVNSTSPTLNAQCTKRGDVVVIMPDGWGWSPAELAGDPWLVIKAPGVDPADLSSLLAPEPEDVQVPHKLLQRRAFNLNLDAYDGKGLDRVKAFALRQRKPPILDPDFL